MKGFDYMAGFVGPETRVIAPPIPDTPRIADYFKTGKSLSATFKEYDEAMEAFLRSMAQYLNVESFDPAINSGGSSTSQVQSALGAVYPWVQYPIFQDGKIDYLLLHNYISHEMRDLELEAKAQSETAPYLPFRQTILNFAGRSEENEIFDVVVKTICLKPNAFR
jgi:hypothetical protein